MDELVEILEENYDIKVESIEKIKNAFKLRTGDRYKCFKACKYDLKQFEFIVNAISYLMEGGYEEIVPINLTKAGEKYIEYNGGYGFLCDWVGSREANFDNQVELRLCIESLAKLHLASRGFNYEINSSVRNQYGKWIYKFKKRCDELLYFKTSLMEKKNYSEFDRIYLKYFEDHYRQGLKTIRDLENSKYLQIVEEHRSLSEFCHHDTANHNFLITAEGRIYLIDFDYCIYDTHLHDLGSILIRNLKYGNWDIRRLEYILDIYTKFIPISKEEKQVIFCFMEFPQDFWQVGLQYYVEKQSWEEGVFLKKLIRIVNDSKERYQFLKNLEGGVFF